MEAFKQQFHLHYYSCRQTRYVKRDMSFSVMKIKLLVEIVEEMSKQIVYHGRDIVSDHFPVADVKNLYIYESTSFY